MCFFFRTFGTDNNNNMKHRKLFIALAALLMTPAATQAQQLEGGASINGFFDNSEGDATYRRADTFCGTHLMPTITLSEKKGGKHHITAGYDLLTEWGAKPELGADGIVAYYEYNTPRLKFLLGKYPRRKMQQEMPDYLVCDSIKYYRPMMTGFDFQYVGSNGHLEVFLDWTAKRSETVREQFMAGIDTRFVKHNIQVGMNAYYYHYANERGGSDIGHKPHDNTVMHPYAGLCWQQAGPLDSLDIRAGLLAGADRDRATDNKWHTPIGFLGEVNAVWKRLTMTETFYAGGRQQQYGNRGFGQYYWGDTYLQSPWYSRTDIYYTIFDDHHVTLKAGAAFHFTDKGMHFNQLLTLSADIGTR